MDKPFFFSCKEYVESMATRIAPSEAENSIYKFVLK